MNHVSQQLLSGSVSGLLSTLCLQPFDLLKTRIQQNDGPVRMRNGVFVLGTAREIVQAQGITGLWRGTSASLLRNIPGIALYMTTLTQLRTLMSASPFFTLTTENRRSKKSSVLPSLNTTGNLLAGATARVVAGLVLNPFTVLKARFESDMYTYKSVSGGLMSLLKSGPSELFRGVVASSLRDAPYAGLFLVVYEIAKRESSELIPGTTPTRTAIVNGLSAATAGALATMTTQPFDVIKTKVQVRSENQYQGLFRTIRTVYMQRGPRGFFDGAYLRLSRKIFSSAITWVVFEGLLVFMKSA